MMQNEKMQIVNVKSMFVEQIYTKAYTDEAGIEHKSRIDHNEFVFVAEDGDTFHSFTKDPVTGIKTAVEKDRVQLSQAQLFLHLHKTTLGHMLAEMVTECQSISLQDVLEVVQIKGELKEADETHQWQQRWEFTPIFHMNVEDVKELLLTKLMVKNKKMLALNYKATLLKWSEEKLQAQRDNLMNNAEFIAEIQKEYLSLKAELDGVPTPVDANAAPVDDSTND